MRNEQIQLFFTRFHRQSHRFDTENDVSKWNSSYFDRNTSILTCDFDDEDIERFFLTCMWMIFQLFQVFVKQNYAIGRDIAFPIHTESKQKNNGSFEVKFEDLLEDFSGKYCWRFVCTVEPNNDRSRENCWSIETSYYQVENEEVLKHKNLIFVCFSTDVDISVDILSNWRQTFMIIWNTSHENITNSILVKCCWFLFIDSVKVESFLLHAIQWSIVNSLTLNIVNRWRSCRHRPDSSSSNKNPVSYHWKYKLLFYRIY